VWRSALAIGIDAARYEGMIALEIPIKTPVATSRSKLSGLTFRTALYSRHAEE